MSELGRFRKMTWRDRVRIQYFRWHAKGCNLRRRVAYWLLAQEKS